MGLQKELEAKNLDGVIRELTENPSCIDDVTEKGVPLALYAAELGDFSIVKYIVEYSRASMNTVDENHRNILHYAAASGNLEMNRYLVEKVGMDIMKEKMRNFFLTIKNEQVHLMRGCIIIRYAVECSRTRLLCVSGKTTIW